MSEMRRAKSQVLFRYTPKSMFRYNETNGWCEVSSIEMKNTRQLSSALKDALWRLLHTWDAIQSDQFPDPKLFPNKYEVGEPYQVHYTLTPLVFVCRWCKRVQWYDNIDKLIQFNYNLNCRGCKNNNTLVQVPYIYIHECGRSDNVFIPKHPKDHIIVMNNRGRFQESNWFCETCKQPLTIPGKQGLGLRNCACGPKKLKRGTTLQDPAVHYTRTISLVDTEDAVLERAEENTSLGEILLAGLLRIADYHVKDFEDLLSPVQTSHAAQDVHERMRQGLINQGITDQQQLEKFLNIMEAQLASPQVDKQQRIRNEVHTLLNPSSPLIKHATTSRPLLEYLFVRDHPRMQSQELSSLLEEALKQGDEMTQERYEQDKKMADRLGLIGLHILEAFPLLLAAIGYSRVYSEPKSNTTTSLRPLSLIGLKFPFMLCKVLQKL